jgi:hypothetical protein
MPLIDIIGITNINTNFFIAFAFVQNEDEEAYTWVLNYLKTLYSTHELPLPIVVGTDRELALINSLETVFSTTKHMLCSWHVEKAIVAFCRPYFRGRDEDDWLAFINEWRAIFYVKTENDYQSLLVLFVDKWATDATAKDCVAYIQNTWLYEWADALLPCFTNKFLHFGVTTTSRAEGAHALIKKALKVSTGNLHQVRKLPL